jgi:MFS family permease
MTNETTRMRKRRLPATIIALGMASFFNDVGSEMIFPLLPVFLTSLGAGTAFLGLVEGLADAVSSLLKLGSGFVADRVGRNKPLVVFGYGIAALARPLIAAATLPWHVLAVRVTDRVGKGVRTTPRDVLIASSVPQEATGRAFGFHRAMDHAGAVVGPLIATALLGLGWDMRRVFFVVIVPGLLSVVCVLVVREAARAARPGDGASKTDAQPASGAWNTEGGAVRNARLPGPLRSYFAILALFSLGNSSDAFLLLRARGIGLSVAVLPLLWAVFHVAKVVTSYVGGDWSDRIARHKLIIAGWGVYAATYLAFGLATRAWHVWALFIIYGTYYGLTEPAEKALVRDIAPANVRGRAYGFYNFIIGASAVPAGVLTGWLWQTWSPLAALATGAGIVAASSVMLVVWARGRPAAA